ncbi:hypothetical protein STA3757_00050 [Stanieria sp. NIES-3757]|nr:hypothetical protein STA3757_00050 [Stanieria sp. NIES-3757]
MNNSVNIFCYGSLMYPKVWDLVVEGKYQQQQARIFGYGRKKIKNEEYPGLISTKQEDFVEGIVYFNVSFQDLKRLDLFEGNQYIRIRVNCLLADTFLVETQTYMINPHQQSIVENEDWNQEKFAQWGLEKFLNKYQGFSAF